MGTIINNRTTDTGGTMPKSTTEKRIEALNEQQEYITEHIAKIKEVMLHADGLYVSAAHTIYERPPTIITKLFNERIARAEAHNKTLAQTVANLSTESEVRKAILKLRNKEDITDAERQLLAMTLEEKMGVDHV